MTTAEALLKLKNPGDRATLTVASCALLPFGDYPEVEFIGVDSEGGTVAVRVPQSSADRQLARIERTYESVVGDVITIKRDPNSKQPSKPYWGLYLESSGAKNGRASSEARSAVGATPEPKRVPPATVQAPVSRADVERVLDAAPVEQQGASGAELYLKITKWVLKEIPQYYEVAGLTPDADTIAAISATLFIQASRNGH
jgi:hypothetical protein